jgi:hypothetical protein
MLGTQLALVARIRDADLVYVRLHFLTILVVLVSRALKKPVVVEVNGSYDDTYVAWPRLRRFARFVEFLQGWQLRLAPMIIVSQTS